MSDAIACLTVRQGKDLPTVAQRDRRWVRSLGTGGEIIRADAKILLNPSDDYIFADEGNDLFSTLSGNRAREGDSITISESRLQVYEVQ